MLFVGKLVVPLLLWRFDIVVKLKFHSCSDQICDIAYSRKTEVTPFMLSVHVAIVVMLFVVQSFIVGDLSSIHVGHSCLTYYSGYHSNVVIARDTTLCIHLILCHRRLIISPPC